MRGGMMSTRAQQLAERFEAVTSELASFVESMDSEEWTRKGEPAPDTPDWSVGEDEKRPVGCIAYHIAAVIGVPHTVLLKEAIDGKPLSMVHDWTVENVGEWNAGVAEEQVNVTKAEVLELLNSNAQTALDLIRSLSDEQLQQGLSSEDDTALLPWCGGAKTLDQLIEHMLIGHVQLHRSSMHAAVGR